MFGADLGDLDVLSDVTTWSYNETTTNATDYVLPQGLYLTHQILTNILLMGVMFTMGAGLSKELVTMATLVHAVVFFSVLILTNQTPVQ